MANLDLRERKNAAILYSLIALAIFIWWSILVLLPETRVHFLGEAFAEQFIWILLIPDLISALALGIWLVPAILKNNPHTNAVAWLHVGGQGYAFLISIALAIIDPKAYWGLVGMFLSTGIAFFLACRLQNFNVLWGKFKFKPAKSSSVKTHCKRALIQTVIMWVIFLAIIPAIIASMETQFQFNQHWLKFPAQIPLAIVLFCLFGSCGLWGTLVMTRHGDGTPLPSEHTNKLVIEGPYQYIRNLMALSGTMQAVAVGLGIGSPLIMAYGILGAFAWNILVRPAEEAQLFDSFGEQFLSYQTRVKCWLPTFKSIQS